MLRWLKALSLSLPGTQSVRRENEHLRSRVSELQSCLANCEREIGDLRLKVEQSAREALWVPQGHFYSPVVNPNERSVQQALASEAQPDQELNEFGIEESTLLQWFHRVAEHYRQHPFAEQPSGSGRYFYANPNFPLADALALLTFMVEFRPVRLIEVGSGYSSCAAIDVSEQYLNRKVRFTFIDPHPELALQLAGAESEYADCFVRAKLQDVPTERFAELEPNDILFLDSSHVSKTGSDVVDYLFRIIPSLKPGVLIHIHDIFFPFEYPRAWVEAENRSWSEAYILRAYLHGNSSLRVLYFSDWFYKCRRSLVEAQIPDCIAHRGGSLWMEKL